MEKIDVKNISSIIVLGKIWFNGKYSWFWSSEYLIITKNNKIIKGSTKIYEGYPGYDSYYWTTLKVLGITTDDINTKDIAWHYDYVNVAHKYDL